MIHRFIFNDTHVIAVQEENNQLQSADLNFLTTLINEILSRLEDGVTAANNAGVTNAQFRSLFQTKAPEMITRAQNALQKFQDQGNITYTALQSISTTVARAKALFNQHNIDITAITEWEAQRV